MTEEHDAELSDPHQTESEASLQPPSVLTNRPKELRSESLDQDTDDATTETHDSLLIGPETTDNDIVIYHEPTEEDRQQARDRIIATIHDFCIFMRDLYVPEENILIPPESGWPEITKESFARLGKDDCVVEVLRHLTYIENGPDGAYQIIPASAMADYRSPYFLNHIRDGGNVDKVLACTDIHDDEYPTPPNVLGLMFGGRDTHLIMVDCDTDRIWEHGTGDGRTAYPGWFSDTNTVAVSTGDFFGDIKEKFRNMVQLPVNATEVCSEREDSQQIMGELKEIYSSHGWPENFQKEACAEAVQKLWRKTFYGIEEGE